MIFEKYSTIFIWIALLSLSCVLPFLNLLKINLPRLIKLYLYIALILIWIIASGLCIFLQLNLAATSPIVIALIFLLPFAILQSGKEFMGGLAALPLISATIWWQPSMHLELFPSIVFAGLGLVAMALPFLPNRQDRIKTAESYLAGNIICLKYMFLVLVISALPSIFPGQTATKAGFHAVWHHWGAYVAPVQALLGGAIPFRDFPVQYGMGPTLLIAVLGGDDPFMGTYRATAFINVIYIGSLVGAALVIHRRQNSGWIYLIQLSLMCAAMLWTGYPPDYQGPLSMPSGGGMRFMPLAVLVFFIVHGEESRQLKPIRGYAIWFISLVWSPEAAVYSTIVWYPYLALRSAQTIRHRTFWIVAKVVLSWASIAVAALTAGLFGLALLFRIGFQNWPSLSGYLTYMVNPPGMISPNITGPVWLLAGVIIVSSVAILRTEGKFLRINAICLLALVAVSSYYIGRSHDNNILNIFPFVVLALASALLLQLPALAVGFARFVLAGIVAWSATFGFGSLRESLLNGHAAELGPKPLLERFNFITPESWSLLDAWAAHRPVKHSASSDAGKLLAWVADKSDATILVFNSGYIIPRQAKLTTWTGMNNIANFGFIPREIVVHFIHEGAVNIHKSGWLILDKENSLNFLNLYLMDYNVIQQENIGGYIAFYLNPK